MNGRERAGTARIGLLILILLVLIPGCAGKTSGAMKSEPAAKAGTAQAGNETSQVDAIDQAFGNLAGKGGKSEYIDTPFGMVKRPGGSGNIPGVAEKKDVPEGVAPGGAAAPGIDGKETDRGKRKAAVPAGIASPKVEPPKAGEDGGVTLNFDDADLYEVIRTFSEILKFNYIVDPNIRGRVTIQTAGSLGKEDVFTVFYQILEANGLTAVKEGSLYRIVKMKESPRLPLLVREGGEGEEETFSPDQKIILQIVPLKFISAQEMTKILTPFISADGTILGHEGSNHLILVDKGINILKCLKLVEVFDADLFDRVSHRFYFLQNTKADDLAKILKEVLSSYSIGKKDDVKLIPIERLNALLVISAQKGLIEEIDPFLRELDIPSESAEPQIYVYFVKNGEAKQLGELLQNIFTKDSGKKKDEIAARVKAPTNPLSMGAVKAEETPKPSESPSAPAPATGGAETGSGAIRGEVGITVDEVRNALIVKALPRDYQIIQNVLLRIDIMPRQVLIEVMIAEISLTDTTDLGVEWSFDGLNAVSPLGGIAASIGKAGLTYSVQLTNHWKAALKALASENKVNVLSSPHILASDNKEAKIDVSDELPVATTTYTDASSSSTTGVYETSIQYRDTGILLTVTPHINDSGLVTMDISQEVSEPGKEKTVVDKTYPSFTKRTVNTTLTVKHGQTIVIGGLIKEKVTDTKEGLPCLIQVPVLRFLGGREYKEIEKKELVIMITPRVIVSLEDVDAVTDEFRKKVKNVSKRFEEYRKGLLKK